MSAKLLKQVFDAYHEAPISAWDNFYQYCENINANKGEILKKADSKERYLFFIIEGGIGLFLWSENKYVCLDVAFENHLFADYMSLLLNVESPIQVEAIENCELLRISRENYLSLSETDIGNTLMRRAAESSFIAKQQQQIDLLTKTASDRYALLMKHQPQVISRLSQGHLASFLGVTPQSLSRIKKNFA